LFRVIGGAAAGDPQPSHRVHELPDPVGASFVDSLAGPGGNATGFVVFEFRLAGKWLELLKLIAPNVTRAAVIRDPVIFAGIGQWGAIQTAAPSFGVEVSHVRDAGEISSAPCACPVAVYWKYAPRPRRAFLRSGTHCCGLFCVTSLGIRLRRSQRLRSDHNRNRRHSTAHHNRRHNRYSTAAERSRSFYSAGGSDDSRSGGSGGSDDDRSGGSDGGTDAN
jgi:hypothetical protein